MIASLIVAPLLMIQAEQAPCYVRSPGRCDTHYQQVREAQDRRDSAAKAVQEDIATFPTVGLAALGAIGDQAACDRIVGFLGDVRPPVRLAAASALALCGRQSDVPAIIERLNGEQSGPVRAALLEALGFAGGEVAIAELQNQYTAAEDKMPVLYGLLQASVYGGPSVTDRANLPYSEIMALITPDRGEEARLAAYFLSRLTDLPSVINGVHIREAYTAMRDPTIKALILRLARQYTERPDMIAFASAALLEEGGHLGVEALRTLAAIDPSEATTQQLLTLAAGGDRYVAQAALAALATRSGLEDERREAAQRAITSDSKWIQVRGFELLFVLDKPAALSVAKAWLDEGRYYRSFRIAAVLAGDDEGKALLDAYRAENPDTVLAAEFPGADLPQPDPRPTPPYSEAQALTSGRVVLETTKGEIVIAFNPRTPFAVHNFVRYVEAGGMNASYWHRVIPGFVAQWGQSRSEVRQNWGAVRDNVQVGQHTPGTVGMATAGKDTGGTQFFINTTYNMHLNGRYTVVGQVIDGYDVALAIDEGDKVISARFDQAPK